VEVPVALVEKSARALFEMNPHYEENFLFQLTRGGHRDQNPFFAPAVAAVDAVRPGLAAAYQRCKEIYKAAPWAIDCFLKRREFQPGESPLGDGREVALEVYFPRTAEARLALRGSSSCSDLAKYPLDPVEFARSYARLQAEGARIAVEQLGDHDHAPMFRKQAAELADLADAIEASAASPISRARMIVTRAADGTVLSKECVPVME
jgi:hypothetical protein